jgi:hypothetical protein
MGAYAYSARTNPRYSGIPASTSSPITFAKFLQWADIASNSVFFFPVGLECVGDAIIIFLEQDDSFL